MSIFSFWHSVAAWSIAIALGATPALAAPAKHTPKAKGTTPVVVLEDKTAKKSPPNFEAIFGFMDKLFPPQPDPDPARLALARTSVQSMWPDGAYAKLMVGFMGGMIDRAMQLKKSDFAELGGKAKAASAAATTKDLSLHDEIAAKDPYFDKRMAAIRGAVDEEMGKVSAIIDPRMREGMTRAMARRFDGPQLTDINRFFATPSGHAFAGQYMQLWMDPDTIRSIFGSVPEMMKLMPEMMQKIKAADEKFPKPPSKDPAKTPAKETKEPAAPAKG
jgi:hypothetical protein